MSDNKKDGKGFAGLDSMVSDVSDDVRNVSSKPEQKRQEPPRTPPPSSPSVQSEPVQPQPTPQSRPAPIVSGKQPSGGKNWFVWGGIIFFLIWVFGNSGKSNNTNSYSPPPPSYSAPSSYSPTPAPAPAPVPAPAVVSSDGEKPPVGNGLSFNREQIRYCLTEKYRISAIEGILDNTHSNEVTAFNAMVDDYNSRCSHFRYRRGMLEGVRSEVDANQASIAASAKSKWIRNVLGLQSSTNAPSVPAASSQRVSMASQPPSTTNETLSYEEKESIESACALDKQVNGPAAYNRCVSNKLAALKSSPRNIDLSGLSYDEKESVESSCALDKQVNGPGAYNRCVSGKLSSLRNGPRNIDLSGLSYDEKESIESSCALDKQVNGPAAYNRCVSSKLAALKSGPRNLDMSQLSYSARESIESACALDKQINGPAAYNRCVVSKMKRAR